MPLEGDALERYRRQLLVPGWGEEGQRRISRACVLVAGAGGLGCPVSLYLAVAGVGEVRVCDADRVDRSNLNRQIHYTEADIGRSKAGAAAARLTRMNSGICVRAYNQELTENNIEDVTAGVDVVVDCLDNFRTRYLLNSLCVDRGVPLVHGAVWGLGGQVALLIPPRTACLQCVFPEAPPPEAEFPVVGAGAGRVGCAQALLTLKQLLGMAEAEQGHMVVLEDDPLGSHRVRLRRMPDCPACSQQRDARR